MLPVAFVLVWSSGYLAGTIGAHSGPPLALLFWRFLLAFLVLGAVAVVPLFGERLGRTQRLGLGIGLAGVAVSLSGKLDGHGSVAGYVLTGLALLGFAAGTLYQKRFGQSVDLRTGTTVQLLGGMLTTLPLAALHGGVLLPMTVPAIGSTSPPPRNSMCWFRWRTEGSVWSRTCGWFASRSPEVRLRSTRPDVGAVRQAWRIRDRSRRWLTSLGSC